MRCGSQVVVKQWSCDQTGKPQPCASRMSGFLFNKINDTKELSQIIHNCGNLFYFSVEQNNTSGQKQIPSHQTGDFRIHVNLFLVS